ncbi:MULTISPECIES: glycoside hydrolase family 2 protein [unclassified Streptomyces]|uniref:glycoside hydrolase family 2 protein n=1 Tax=unclassified Streptomyces TaxID=2593676 RepID=UPI002E22BBDA
MDRSSLDISRRHALLGGLAGIGVALVSGSPAGAVDRSRPQERRELSLNTDWAFWREDAEGAQGGRFDDSRWAAVSVPHTMRLESKSPSAYGVFAGVGWYRRYFRIDPHDQGKRLTLRFEGVQTDCDVYLNGVRLAGNHGGYIGFGVDISDCALFDRDNVLAVRVSNADDPLTPPGKPRDELGFLTYGGIYRDVTLRVTDQVRITDPLQEDRVAGGGVFVTCLAASTESARLEVRTHVRNGTRADRHVTLTSTLFAPDGTAVADATATANTASGEGHDFVQNLTVRRPELWHPDHPHLYRLDSRVSCEGHPTDSLTTMTGIRRIDYRADGFWLNGERLYLRGANCHQNYAYIGDAAPASLQYREALRLKLGGFNAVRAAHYPHAPAFLDAADELGLLVVACEPGWQYWNGDPTFVDRTHADIARMIRRDRNHPSVILWETALNETAVPESWARQATAIAHAEMPSDQMFTAADFGEWGRQHYDVNYKVVNPDGSDPAPTKPFLTREWGDWEDPSRAGRDDGESALIQQVEIRQRYLNGDGYWDWGGLDANDRIGGYFLWVFEDYGTNDVYQKSGVVDIDRYPKFCYHWLKSMRPAEDITGLGPVVHIASAYTASSSRKVMVFSNADTVRLYRDGKLLAARTRAENAATAPHVAAKGGSPYYLFDLPSFRAGELTAEGYLHGKRIATHTVRTPGAAHHIEIEPDDAGVRDALTELLTHCLGGAAGPDDVAPLLDRISPDQLPSLVRHLGMLRGSPLPTAWVQTLRTYTQALSRIQPVADGRDLMPVFIKVVDEHGTVVPDSAHTVAVSVAGHGNLVGAGIPRIAVETQKVQAGIGYALIATGTRSGPVTVTVTADGLRAAHHTLQTRPSTAPAVADGHHSAWQDIATLEDQGTQNPALFKKTTASSTAQGTGNMPGNAVDDDETTQWLAAGTGTAWWQVDLDQRFPLDGFQIVWATALDACQYSILTSDDAKTWTTAVDETTNTTRAGTVTHSVHTTTRHVRVDIRSAAGHIPGIREFRAIPPGTTGGAPPVAPGPEIARDRITTVTASSYAPGFEPDKAFDGNTTFGTGWSASGPSTPQTLTAELAVPFTLAGVRVHWGKDSSTYTYDLQVSTDGSSWTTVLNQLTRSGQTTLPETFTATGIRSVRAVITDVTGGGGQTIAGIAEMTLYGSPT